MVLHFLGKKGELNLGFIVSVVLLISLVMFAAVHLLKFAPSVQEKSEYAFVKTSAFKVSRTIVDSPGYPKDWTSSPEALGLAKHNTYSGKTERAVLDPEKVEYVSNSSDYSSFKESLTMGRDLDFRLIIKNETSTVVDLKDTLPGKTSNVVRMKRSAVLSDNKVNVTILVWS